MKRPPLAVLVVLAILAPAVGMTQDRGPAERQKLLDLAFVIGESHALRQVCAGAGDQFWRSRMVRLAEVERADQAFDAQLRDRFNTGFAARQGQFQDCDEASVEAERAAARRGQALAARLAQSMRLRAPAEQAAPDSVADD